MYIARADLRLHGIGRLSRESRDIMKTGYLLCQGRQFGPVKRVLEFTTAENQVDVAMGDVAVEDMIAHGAERRDAGAGTNEKEILFDVVGQGEDALRSAEGQLAADIAMIEQVVRAGASLQQDDHQLDDICAVGPGRDGIATDAFVQLLMNGQIERHE